MKPDTYALCMIVKDEASNVRRVIDQLKLLFDEVVIVDTGSTDGTPEAARGRGARVVQETARRGGVFRFDVARNAALDAATADWVFFLDADESVRPNSLSHDMEVAQRDDLDAVCFDRCNRIGPGVGFERLNTPRLWRRSLGWRYAGPVFEYLPGAFDIDPNRVGAATTLILHDGLQPRVTQRKTEFYRGLLLEAIDFDAPQSTYLICKYGEVLSDLEMHDAAIDAVRRSLSLADSDHTAFLCRATLGRILMSAGDVCGARDCFAACIADRPTDLGARTGLGIAHAMLGDIGAAIEVFFAMLEKEAHPHVLWNLAVLHRHEGREAHAAEIERRARDVAPWLGAEREGDGATPRHRVSTLSAPDIGCAAPTGHGNSR